MAVSKVIEKIPHSPGVEKVTKQDNSFSNQILILFSAPLLREDFSPIENLSLQEEINAIALVLEDISHPIAVEIVVKVATSQTLQDVLSNRIKPLIIHFIGHGMRDRDSTALVLEDEVGITRSFSEEELAIALSWIHHLPEVREKLLQEMDTLGDSPDLCCVSSVLHDCCARFGECFVVWVSCDRP